MERDHYFLSPIRHVKLEIDLTHDEVEAILRTAELWREDYYLFIELNGEARGLRTGG